MEELASLLAAIRALPYWLKLSTTVAWTLAAAAWLGLVARRCGPGRAAAVATLPVVLVNALVPLAFHRIGGAATRAEDEAVTVAFAGRQPAGAACFFLACMHASAARLRPRLTPLASLTLAGCSVPAHLAGQLQGRGAGGRQG